jgi:hypothetical protein
MIPQHALQSLRHLVRPRLVRRSQLRCARRRRRRHDRPSHVTYMVGVVNTVAPGGGDLEGGKRGGGRRAAGGGGWLAGWLAGELAGELAEAPRTSVRHALLSSGRIIAR